jgi:orotate phosphoribosyltransferase
MSDINPNNLLGGITFASLILWIIGFAGVISIADVLGLLPNFIARWIAKNRLNTTLKGLKLLGVRVSWNEDQANLSFLQKLLDSAHIKEPAYKIQLRQLLKDATYDGKYTIGKSRSFEGDSFIDVMGESTEFNIATKYARILNTHASLILVADYDLVATPKDGSPILGYEFSKLVGKSFVLSAVEKASEHQSEMGDHLKLDYPKHLTLHGKKVLLVDDSTTGGRKMVSLANTLRDAGAIVVEALVLFEPQGKGARELLQSADVNLHSIVDGPTGRF